MKSLSEMRRLAFGNPNIVAKKYCNLEEKYEVVKAKLAVAVESMKKLDITNDCLCDQLNENRNKNNDYIFCNHCLTDEIIESIARITTKPKSIHHGSVNLQLEDGLASIDFREETGDDEGTLIIWGDDESTN